jgi:hypothetical protein
VRTRGFAAPAFAGCALVIRNRRLVYVRYAPVGTSSNEHGLGVRNGLGSRRWDSITRPDLGRLENLGEIALPRFVRKKAEDRARAVTGGLWQARAALRAMAPSMLYVGGCGVIIYEAQ